MKSYREFINESESDIHSICRKYGIEDYTINYDGSIDVDGDVDLRGSGFWKVFNSRSFMNKVNHWTLDELPLKFNKVNGKFDCRYNNLRTLKGCPKEVDNFFISDNKLESLEGCPKEVERFLAGDNMFKDLVGGPEIVLGDFNVSRNPNLVSLKGGPRKIGGYYDISNTGLLDPNGICETKNILDQYQTIDCKNTPFSNVLILFLSKGFGLRCDCLCLYDCPHVKDNKYIYEMIRMIIDSDIIDGEELNVDRLYSLYYDLVDDGGVYLRPIGKLDLPGYILV